MTRFERFLPLLVALLLSPVFVAAQDVQSYCVANQDSPECYCPAHPLELKCLRFFGANPGFSAKGAGTSATFNNDKAAPPPAQGISTTPPPPPPASPTIPPEVRPSDYILFIHYGSASNLTNLPNASSLIRKLKDSGYVVRGADDQRDHSGSGIDYFRKEDKEGAQAIADSVNDWLKENDKPELARLTPRHQSVSNPSGYIGVWIFGRPAP
jgi:hypothetical protein